MIDNPLVLPLRNTEKASECGDLRGWPSFGGEKVGKKEKMKERRKQSPPDSQGEIKVVQGDLLSLRGEQSRELQKNLGGVVEYLHGIETRCREWTCGHSREGEGGTS